MHPGSEEHPTALARSVLLPRPTRGRMSRVQIGRAELVLEHNRGSYSLLWSDGRDSRRYVLGLSTDGQLSIDLMAPSLPIHVVPRELIAIVPKARIRGFITIPLVPTVVWRDSSGRSETLIQLHSPQLQGQWHEETGHSLRSSATWIMRFPFQTGEPQVVVPLRLYNDSSDALCPSHLELEICNDDLFELRGSILVSPRRMRKSNGCMREYKR